MSHNDQHFYRPRITLVERPMHKSEYGLVCAKGYIRKITLDFDPYRNSTFPTLGAVFQFVNCFLHFL